MTTTLRKREIAGIWGLAILLIARIWLDRRWPGSLATVVLSWANTTLFMVWIGSRIWAGYRRRRPHWTRESWLRYARLAVVPVLALIALFTELAFFDNRSTGGVFGSPKSALRTVWVLIDLSLMAVGTIGIIMAIDWLARGEPSEQFTRTRWFRRRKTSAIAD